MKRPVLVVGITTDGLISHVPRRKWCFKCGIYGGGHRVECPSMVSAVWFRHRGWIKWRTWG